MAPQHSVVWNHRGRGNILNATSANFSARRTQHSLAESRHVTFAAWASYQIRKIAGCACAGNAGNGFARRRFQRKLLVSDPGMHHGTCVTHVPWCMPGSPTCGDGENVPGIPGACAPAILHIWQDAHVYHCAKNSAGFPNSRWKTPTR